MFAVQYTFSYLIIIIISSFEKEVQDADRKLLWSEQGIANSYDQGDKATQQHSLRGVLGKTKGWKLDKMQGKYWANTKWVQKTQSEEILWTIKFYCPLSMSFLEGSACSGQKRCSGILWERRPDTTLFF